MKKSDFLYKYFVFCSILFLSQSLLLASNISKKDLNLNREILGQEVRVLESVANPDLVKNMILNKDFILTTKSNQFIQLLIFNNFVLSVFQNSEVKINLSDLDQDQKPLSIDLVNGEIYIENLDIESSRNQSYSRQKNQIHNNKISQKMNVKSDFFDWTFTTAQNLAVRILYLKDDGRIHFCNQKHIFEVALFDHEIKTDLNPFEGVSFQGILENKKISYDYLLKGRKIPKGQWLPIEKCTFQEIEKKKNELIKVEQDGKNKFERQIKLKILKKKSDDSKYLCHHPYGQFNDCYWELIKNQCIRSRCNAQGKWSDVQILSSASKNSLCKVKSSVRVCDY